MIDHQPDANALDPADLWCEAHCFAQQLTAASLVSDPADLSFDRSRRQFNSFSTLRQFLQCYTSEVLIPFELPTIRDAYLHASRFEIRELVLADCKLGQDPRLRQFATASQQIGKSQLMRLRPLRDQRIVQRYLKAVEENEAPGWHTIVLGLILSLYSLPLRQGLVNYGQQTLRGFIYSANRSLGLEEAQCEALHNELCLPLGPSVEALLSDLSVIR